MRAADRSGHRLFRWALGPQWRPAPRSAVAEYVAGRRILITGASAGIGRACALLLADLGAPVALLARREQQLTAVADEITDAGGVAEVVVCDLSDPASIASAVQVINADPAEIIVNAAGLSIRRSVAETVDRFDTVTRTMACNYLGPVQLATGLLPAMRARGRGHLIEISTVSVDLPTPAWSAYAASKAAFDCWLRAVGPEVADDGISVSSLHFPLVHNDSSARTYPSWVPGLSPSDAASVVTAAILRRPRELSVWWARAAAHGWRCSRPLADRLAGRAHRGTFRRLGRTP
jgi:short-subunit dehydrogenase